MFFADPQTGILKRAYPKLSVYTHIVLLARPPITAITVDETVDELVAQPRQTYAGPLEVGDDLMTVEIDNAGQPIAHRRSAEIADVIADRSEKSIQLTEHLPSPRKLGRGVVDGILPSRCLACGAIVDEPDTQCGRRWAGVLGWRSVLPMTPSR